MSDKAFEWLIVDVETANSRDRASICQVGALLMRDDSIQETYTTLVNPECEFDFYSTNVHGLTETDVVGAPTLDRVLVDIRDLLKGRLWVSQSNYDLICIRKAMGRIDYDRLSCSWKNSIPIFRSVWPEKAKKNGGTGYRKN